MEACVSDSVLAIESQRGIKQLDSELSLPGRQTETKPSCA